MRLRIAVILVVGGMLVLAVAAWACGGAATPTAASLAEAYVSSNLPADYAQALPAATQLILGTFRLEGTANAVTAEQARVLLPLWKSLQSGALQGTSEVNAVLGQIERTMTPAQLQAIAAMHLTQENLAAWLQEHGMAPGLGRPEGTPGAWPRGTPGIRPVQTPGAGGPGGLDPAARQTMRAGFESMSEEERARWMATAQAGGMPGGGLGRAWSGGGVGGQFRFLLPPLIELLTQRAGP